MLRRGIAGLDAVLHGGFPTGRTTIVIGGPGGGKTVLATQFLVNGATHFDEPGLMISFEESPEALKANFPGLGWPADGRSRRGRHFVDGRMPEDAIEAGGFDLGGLIAIASSIVQEARRQADRDRRHRCALRAHRTIRRIAGAKFCAYWRG